MSSIDTGRIPTREEMGPEDLITLEPIFKLSKGNQIVMMIPPDGTLWVNPEVGANEAGRVFINWLNGKVVHTTSSQLHTALMNTQEENTRLEQKIANLERINLVLAERLGQEKTNMVPAESLAA